MSRFQPTTDSPTNYASSGSKIPSKIGQSRTNALVQRFASMSPDSGASVTLSETNSLKPSNSFKQSSSMENSNFEKKSPRLKSKSLTPADSIKIKKSKDHKQPKNSGDSKEPTDHKDLKAPKTSKTSKTNAFPSESTSTLKTESEKRKKRKKEKKLAQLDNNQIHNEEGEVVAKSSTIRKSGHRKHTTSIEVVTPTESPVST